MADPPYVHPAKQARSRVYLERVVRGARAVIEGEGVDRLTMAAVARAAGVSTGGIYRRFPDKLSLLRLLKDFHLAELEAFVAARLHDAAERPDAVINAFVAAHVERFSESENLFRFLVSPNPDAVFASRGLTQIQRMSALFSRALQPFAEEIAHADPSMAAEIGFHLVFSALSQKLRVATPGISWVRLGDELSLAARLYLLGAAPRPLASQR